MEKKKIDTGGFYEIDVDKDITELVDDFKSRLRIHKKVIAKDVEIGVRVYEKQSNEINRDISIIVFCSDFSRDKYCDRILFDKKKPTDDKVKIFFDKKRLEDVVEFFGSIRYYFSPKSDSKKLRKMRVTFVEIAPFSIVGDWISWIKELIGKNHNGIKPDTSSRLLQHIIEFVEQKKSGTEECGLTDPIRVAISGGCCNDVVRELSDLMSLHLILELDPESRKTILYNDQHVPGIKSSHIITFKRAKSKLKEGKNGELGEIIRGNKQKVLYDGPNASRSGVGTKFVSFNAKTEYFEEKDSQIFPKSLIFKILLELRKQEFFENINKK